MPNTKKGRVKDYANGSVLNYSLPNLSIYIFKKKVSGNS
jgi:hypothetical protein